MKLTKRIMAVAACAVMAASSMASTMVSAADIETSPDYYVANAGLNHIEDDVPISRSMWQAVDAWASSLLNSSSYGKALTSNTWYNDVDEVEVLARVIYGENTSDTIDQCAISWIIFNRKNSSIYPNTYKGVVTAPSQFSSLNGTQAKNYKNNSTNVGWRNATYLACKLMVASTESDYLSLAGRPQGISNQLCFRGPVSYFYDNCRMNGTQLQLQVGSTWENVYDVVVVGNTMSNSSLISTKADVFPHKDEAKNIYFSE